METPSDQGSTQRSVRVSAPMGKKARTTSAALTPTSAWIPGSNMSNNL